MPMVRRYVIGAITLTTRIRAPRMDITVLTGSPAACLLVQVPGVGGVVGDAAGAIAAGTGAAATDTVADGAEVARDMDSAVVTLAAGTSAGMERVRA
jgi:hypothetical protein